MALLRMDSAISDPGTAENCLLHYCSLTIYVAATALCQQHKILCNWKETQRMYVVHACALFNTNNRGTQKETLW